MIDEKAPGSNHRDEEHTDSLEPAENASLGPTAKKKRAQIAFRVINGTFVNFRNFRWAKYRPDRWSTCIATVRHVKSTLARFIPDNCIDELWGCLVEYGLSGPFFHVPGACILPHRDLDNVIYSRSEGETSFVYTDESHDEVRGDHVEAAHIALGAKT